MEYIENGQESLSQENLNNENADRLVIERVTKYEEMNNECKKTAALIATIGIATFLILGYLQNTYDINLTILFICGFTGLSRIFMSFCNTLIKKANLKKELIQDLMSKLAMNENNDSMENGNIIEEDRGRSR